jgi:hypothetical protein
MVENIEERHENVFIPFVVHVHSHCIVLTSDLYWVDQLDCPVLCLGGVFALDNLHLLASSDSYDTPYKQGNKRSLRNNDILLWTPCTISYLSAGDSHSIPTPHHSVYIAFLDSDIYKYTVI